MGGNRSLKVKCRILAATNKNLGELVKLGKFREDLFYRLDVLRVNVPPLKERKEDIPELADYFIHVVAKDLNLPPIKLTQNQLNEMLEYDWPGNIRELKNHITRLFFNPSSKLFENNSYIKTGTQIPETWEEMDEMRKKATEKAAREIETLFLDNLLKKFNGNISKAAEHIGINRSNLHKMKKKCGL